MEVKPPATAAIAPEAELKMDANTGAPKGIGIKLRPTETESTGSSSQPEFDGGRVDTLLKLADKALETQGLSLWIILDRLDVAFSSKVESQVEKHAIRSLMRVYLGMRRTLKRIRPKIFLRSLGFLYL